MLKVYVDGDPKGGYIVDVHDGDRFGTYHPDAKNDLQALSMALDEHFPKHEPAAEPAAPVA